VDIKARRGISSCGRRCYYYFISSSLDFKRKRNNVKKSIKKKKDNRMNQVTQNQIKTEYELELRDLAVFYGSFQAVKNVNIKVQKNTTMAFIGPSGCGKSTVLRSINRMNELIPGTRITGEIITNEVDILSKTIDPVEVRKHIGMVFQKPNPFPKSIYDNIAWGVKINGFKGTKSQLDDIVEKSLRNSALWDEVKDKLSQNALRLSGGQQQRLCIARAIAVEPQILLMDEPASALDPIATLKIEDLIRQLVKDYTIVIVTHNMGQAARVSDFVSFFLVDESRTGFLVESGKTEDIFVKPTDKRTEDYISGKFG
jgi:phosphate transport system ATP-binding protein